MTTIVVDRHTGALIRVVSSKTEDLTIADLAPEIATYIKRKRREGHDLTNAACNPAPEPLGK